MLINVILYSKVKKISHNNDILSVLCAWNLRACPANFRRDKVDEFESGSLTLQVEMNADADIVHSKFDRMHARYRIPINRPAGHWKCHRPFGPLIKKLHVTKMSLLLVEEQREWRRRRRRRAFVNSAKMNGRKNASHTKGLADACISQIFLTVERSHGSSVSIPYFSSFSSRVAILARPAISPFDSYENRVRGCTCTSRNFLRLRVCMRNMNVYFSFTSENQHSHSRQVDNAELRKDRECYSTLQTWVIKD